MIVSARDFFLAYEKEEFHRAHDLSFWENDISLYRCSKEARILLAYD